MGVATGGDGGDRSPPELSKFNIKPMGDAWKELALSSTCPPQSTKHDDAPAHACLPTFAVTGTAGTGVTELPYVGEKLNIQFLRPMKVLRIFISCREEGPGAEILTKPYLTLPAPTDTGRRNLHCSQIEKCWARVE